MISKGLSQLIFRFLAKRKLYLVNSLTFRADAPKLALKLDYVRYRTLELCVEEVIKSNVSGSIAEVGVFKGEFAKLLNQLFPEKTLYLFDTFEGFHANDVGVEHAHDYSTGAQDFSDTSVEFVMAKMPFPNKCVVKKGYFPETAEDIEDRFCFVSLDTDLYKPLYDGLQYFYPRLEKGGYIFVHDYNNEGYKGAHEAVQQFCREQGISFVPIPDSGGTIIICK